ncbi:MerR family transcriptional regulator [Demequina aurantiaca]|uniref:MerR family transcriptional regulator n=1 Tax=Demequina aurantiaca TaxID=676200 RepID=UPI003D352B19
MSVAEQTVQRTYSIGELADIAGISVHTLRWYESQGLFPQDIPRTTGGQRVFGPESVGWMTLLRRFRESGMPVAVMARYSDLVRAGAGNEAERIELMEAHARALDAQIEELLVCRDVINGKVRAYREHLAGGAYRIAPRAASG